MWQTTRASLPLERIYTHFRQFCIGYFVFCIFWVYPWKNGYFAHQLQLPWPHCTRLTTGSFAASQEWCSDAVCSSGWRSHWPRRQYMDPMGNSHLAQVFFGEPNSTDPSYTSTPSGSFVGDICIPVIEISLNRAIKGRSCGKPNWPNFVTPWPKGLILGSYQLSSRSMPKFPLVSGQITSQTKTLFDVLGRCGMILAPRCQVDFIELHQGGIRRRQPLPEISEKKNDRSLPARYHGMVFTIYVWWGDGLLPV